jgi:dihydroneopterin triphosphate diphosphatase
VDDGTSPRYLTRVPLEESRVVSIAVGTVDVFVIRPLASGWRVLALQRGAETRCPASWETVHGSIEPGEEPETAAERELLEETGLVADRLYAVAVQPFFMRTVRTVQLAIVFVAFVDGPAEVTVAEEHQSHAWLTVDDAASRFIWPTERNSLRQIVELLGTGDAGPVEDVLRVR